MRSVAALAIILLAVSCGGNTGHSPSPAASGAATASPSSSPSGGPTAANYGLLLTAGTLEMITPAGTIAAHAKVAAPSVHTCGQSTGAVLQPPVSASDNKVYYRDGNTKIKFLTPAGQTGAVTTVPGSATTVSFFSVSPDDSRIAVLVEDLSPATTIKLTLYVEDLTGHTNHSVIFTNTVPKFKNSTTLWPMGWHNGLLALAVFPPCTFEPAGIVPIEWHVSNAVTAVRVAKIGNPCIPSYWPSPAGLACIDLSGKVANRYDWAAHITGSATAQASEFQSGLSPSGRSIFLTPGLGIGAPPPATRIVVLGTGGGSSVAGHSACLWIDEDHLLAPDAVITFPSSTATTATVASKVTALPASGQCAGRFPGGL
ncbi:MAG TPA: hypothetical protein VGJ79_09020 [Candidatus Dormibacteraeota bacterium]